MDYMDKLITLSNGIQYVIIKKTDYEGVKYVLANEVEDGNLGPIVTLFRVEEHDGKVRFEEELDLSLTETVLAKMAY